MADINIDTTSGQYQNLLSGLGTLRTVLAPRIALMKKMLKQEGGRAKVRNWLQRDPLLRRVIIMSQKLSDFINEDLEE